jgi:hypothetical protein
MYTINWTLSTLIHYTAQHIRYLLHKIEKKIQINNNDDDNQKNDDN